MDIDAIIPYERNARRNGEAVPVVAESIREFGLRGQIVLESRDNPVIVCGHTRVAACKSLGRTEIPDANIAYCDGLTEDQIKAFRLADNRTGEVATWNRTLLQHEVKSIRGLDMSRFRFDFKGKAKPYGAERLRTDGAYNLGLVSAADCGADGMPRLAAVDVRPDGMVGFNYARTCRSKDGACCHFFLDDYQFERCWNRPLAQIDALRGFDCVLTPDFSLYLDMPMPMQRWNVYRSRAVGLIWAREGLPVVPTLSWSVPESYGFCFDGLEPGGTYAVSTVGVKEDERALAIWRDGMAEALRRLEPSRVLVYGGDIGFDFGGCDAVSYMNGVTERMADGRQRC